jgi:hypothetical protein
MCRAAVRAVTVLLKGICAKSDQLLAARLLALLSRCCLTMADHATRSAPTCVMCYTTCYLSGAPQESHQEAEANEDHHLHETAVAADV